VKHGVVRIRQFRVMRDRGTSLEVSEDIDSGDHVIVSRPSTSARARRSSRSR
jgi:hypothetical protein